MDLKIKVDILKEKLKGIEESVKELQAEGVILNFNIASEQKTVDVKTASFFEISCKATINQEL